MCFHLSLLSKNRKTGPIPVSMTSRDSCPVSCPLKENGCYAEHGPLGWLWKTRPLQLLSVHSDCASRLGKRKRAEREAIRRANRGGFTVNLSADDLEEADRLAGLRVGPVAVVLPSTQKEKLRTPKGREIVVCPASLRPGDVTCWTCGLCADATRKVIVGFPAHGPAFRKAERVALGKE